MVAMSAALMSADDYFATADLRQRWSELINGEVYVMNTPAVRHQLLVTFLTIELGLWARGAGRGLVPASLDCRLSGGTVLAPDVLWIGPTRIDQLTDAYLNGPPDLAAEIRSPSTWARDIGPKFRAYERAGLPELWLVDSVADTVLVHRRTSGPSGHCDVFDESFEVGVGETLASPLLPGLAIAVGDLFAR
jgi:Uma2 family endonuclease